jgi:hypothetical protein
VPYEVIKGHPTPRIYDFSIIKHPDERPQMLGVPDLEDLSPIVSFKSSTAYLNDNL